MIIKPKYFLVSALCVSLLGASGLYASVAEQEGEQEIRINSIMQTLDVADRVLEREVASTAAVQEQLNALREMQVEYGTTPEMKIFSDRYAGIKARLTAKMAGEPEEEAGAGAPGTRPAPSEVRVVTNYEQILDHVEEGTIVFSDLDETLVAYKEGRAARIHERDMAAEVRGRRGEVIILTNSSKESAMAKIRAAGLDIPDRNVISVPIGRLKHEYLQEKLWSRWDAAGKRPGKAMFIDDDSANAEGMRDYFHRKGVPYEVFHYEPGFVIAQMQAQLMVEGELINYRQLLEVVNRYNAPGAVYNPSLDAYNRARAFLERGGGAGAAGR